MACVVACHHNEALNAVRSQLLHYGHRVGAQYVGDGDGSEESSSAVDFVDVTDDHGCLSLVLKVGNLQGEAVRNGNVLRGEIACVADSDPPAVYKTARTFAGTRLEGGALLLRQPALLGLGDDRLGERMFGLGFDGCSELQQLECGCLRIAAEVYDVAVDDHISDSRLTLGKRPSLIEGHYLY
jgi:hypothetical protein